MIIPHWNAIFKERKNCSTFIYTKHIFLDSIIVALTYKLWKAKNETFSSSSIYVISKIIFMHISYERQNSFKLSLVFFPSFYSKTSEIHLLAYDYQFQCHDAYDF